MGVPIVEEPVYDQRNNRARQLGPRLPLRLTHVCRDLAVPQLEADMEERPANFQLCFKTIEAIMPVNKNKIIRPAMMFPTFAEIIVWQMELPIVFDATRRYALLVMNKTEMILIESAFMVLDAIQPKSAHPCDSPAITWAHMKIRPYEVPRQRHI